MIDKQFALVGIVTNTIGKGVFRPAKGGRD